MNILDRGITQEPGFPRRNLNSHARAAARVFFPPLSHFRKNFWQSVFRINLRAPRADSSMSCVFFSGLADGGDRV